MVVNQLSLPTDIPWKRLGVSKDMMDEKGGDLQFPKKWNSSISVFYHEPKTEDVPPDYCNRKLTYVKIVTTITNYSPEGDDVTVLHKLRDKFEDFYAYKNFHSNVTRSFPCYGALLQVGVYPSGTGTQDTKLHDYPYFSAFEPQKREMYEVVTQSGEIGSQSMNKLNVLKGTTTTDSTEDYKIDQGGGGNFSLLWGAVEAGWSGQEYTGQITRNQTQSQDIRTRDASREKRESHAYTTNINQLYTLLQGYHVGTNRVIFFMQPRPHMLDTKFTFIRGLRRLEGIQEFFLIVNRPAHIPSICVEVGLETAHLYSERAYKPRIIPLHELYSPGNLNKTPEALGIKVSFDINNENYLTEYAMITVWNSTFPEHRYAAGQPEVKWNIEPANWNQSILAWLFMITIANNLPGIGMEQVALIFEEYESNSGKFFVTGRRLFSCSESPKIKNDSASSSSDLGEVSSEANTSTVDATSSVVYSQTYNGRSNIRDKSIEEISRGGDANIMIQDLNSILWNSLGSADRYPYGAVSFMETDFILDELSQLLRTMTKSGKQNMPLVKINEARKYMDGGLGTRSKCRTILDLSGMSTEMIAKDLSITWDEARKIRSQLIHSALKSIDPKALHEEEPENLIQEKFNFRYSRENLSKLVRSAGVGIQIKGSSKNITNRRKKHK